MKHSLFIGAVFCGVIGALLSPTNAFAEHVDGSLPIYPNATPAGFSYGNPRIERALKNGFAMFADTTDSTQTVDRWYLGHLPQSCARHTDSGGIQYKCQSGVVNIVVCKGKTRLAIIPR